MNKNKFTHNSYSIAETRKENSQQESVFAQKNNVTNFTNSFIQNTVSNTVYNEIDSFSTVGFNSIKLLLSHAFDEKESEKIALSIQKTLFDEDSFFIDYDIPAHYDTAQKKLINAILNFSWLSKESILKNTRLTSHKSSGEFLKAYIKNSKTENLYMICLTEENQIISFEKIVNGDNGTVFIDVESLLSHALSKNAKNVVIAHNHVSSFMKYSKEDFYSTEKLCAYFSKSGINLLEHFVIVNGEYHGILFDLADNDGWKEPYNPNNQ